MARTYTPGSTPLGGWRAKGALPNFETVGVYELVQWIKRAGSSTLGDLLRGAMPGDLSPNQTASLALAMGAQRSPAGPFPHNDVKIGMRGDLVLLIETGYQHDDLDLWQLRLALARTGLSV